MFDLEMIREVYARFPFRVDAARKLLGRGMPLCEKILYAHLWEGEATQSYDRGREYADFAPDRVAMQDATAQMALLQFINAGQDKSAVPASIHCDHLIVAECGAKADLQRANEVNSEVYGFLKSAASRYGIGYWRPGAGIIHQVVLENYAFPGGLMIGSDSHTPNAGGLGMLGVGVGGADVTDVMAGLSWELRMPRVIGVRLTGKLGGWATPKDVILRLAGVLSVKGATNCVLEYFGPGCETLSATGKASICNMGAELGATSSVFGLDDPICDYLRATGRNEVADAAQKIAEYLRPDQDAEYDRIIEIDLAELEPCVNGPFSPDLVHGISTLAADVRREGYPKTMEVGLIGSCTNSSYEDLGLAASLARQAVEKGLKAKAKLIINPGSEAVLATARRDGIIADLEAVGAEIMANACGPCIGQWNRPGAEQKKPNSIVTSFNRNFAGRADGNPNTCAFVASPEMVMAFSIAGDVTFNPLTDKLQNERGEMVMLDPPVSDALPKKGMADADNGYEAPVEGAPDVAVDPKSERLQLLKPFAPFHAEDFKDMPLLIKAKGKCTTDHISAAGKWLRFRGHLENISENLLMGATNAFNGEVNSVLNQLTGQYGAVSAVAKAYKQAGVSSIVVTDENYGEGSSREHAALEPRFLNVKAVLARSFARIHETNLKKQGMLAVTFAEKEDYDKVREADRIEIRGLEGFAPSKPLEAVLHHKDGTVESFPVNHTYNETQIGWLRKGAALNK